MLVRDAEPTLAVGCGGNWEYPKATLRDVNLDIHLPSSRVANFVLADAMSMPFRDKSMSIVFASHIIEHLLDTEAFIRECKRVGCSVELRFPRWIFAGAYSDPTHRWFWFRGKFRPIPHPVHIAVRLVFANRLSSAFFSHTSNVNQEVVQLIESNDDAKVLHREESVKDRFQLGKLVMDGFANMSLWVGFLLDHTRLDYWDRLRRASLVLQLGLFGASLLATE